LRFKFFSLQVLDRYRTDPRYRIDEGPVSLFLCIKDEFSNDTNTAESDKICVQSMGYGYRKSDHKRVIVTYLPYLAQLSKEHQNYWVSFEEREECLLDKDFAAQELEGEFTDRVNVFDAFLQELIEINKISELCWAKPLFSKDYQNSKPQELAPITKPTYKCYYELVHIFDKLISENINKKFFSDSIKITDEIQEKDGRYRVIDKGTLQLLELWIHKNVKIADTKPLNDLLQTFKNIRNERMKPAHKLESNIYNPQYFELQKKLVFDAYTAIRFLRLLLMNHPSAKKHYLPPNWLQRGRINFP